MFNYVLHITWRSYHFIYPIFPGPHDSNGYAHIDIPGTHIEV